VRLAVSANDCHIPVKCVSVCSFFPSKFESFRCEFLYFLHNSAGPSCQAYTYIHIHMWQNNSAIENLSGRGMRRSTLLGEKRKTMYNNMGKPTSQNKNRQFEVG